MYGQNENEGRVSSRGDMAASVVESEPAYRERVGFDKSPTLEKTSFSPMDLFAELQSRMKKLETMVSDLRDIVNGAVENGSMDPDLAAHVAHVMRTYYHHDRPVPEVEAPPVPKFDPYTGKALN